MKTYTEYNSINEAVDMNKLKAVQAFLADKFAGKANITAVGKAKGKNIKGDVMLDGTYGTQTVFKIGKAYLAAYKDTMTAKWEYKAFKNVADMKAGKNFEIAGQSTINKDFSTIVKYLEKNI